MKLESTPVLDPRGAADIFDELLRLQPAWTPEMVPAPGEPGYALFQVFARYMQSVIDRLNQAPDKNLLALLDTFGITLIPPQPARAPVVFTPAPSAADASIPARTRLSAKVPELSAPLIFETERDGAMVAARCTDVIALWPLRDQYADHSSDAAGNRSFLLFDPLRPVPHEFYLAHETVFTFSGSTAIDIEFEFATPGSTPIPTQWEFWDGQVWRPFREIDPAIPESGSDGTNGFTRSGVLSLRAGCGDSKPVAVNGVTAHWIRGRATGPLPPDPGRALPQVDRIRVRSVIDASDLAAFPPDAAFADATKLDVTKVFYPFDQQPRTGSTFYFSSTAALGKPGAKVTVSVRRAQTALESNLVTGSNTSTSTPKLTLEYWDGKSWQAAPLSGDASTVLNNFLLGSSLQFTVRPDVAQLKVNEQEGWWMRIRIVDGNFVHVNSITLDGGAIKIITIIPPALENLQIDYTYRSPWMFPEQCLTFSDFQWGVHSRDVRWPGNLFPLFAPVADATPALYFGFDRPLPNDAVSIYLDIEEQDAEGPPLVWEAWDGAAWTEISVEDETGSLTRPGMVFFLPPLVAPRPQAEITDAIGTQVTAKGPLDAARFSRGDQVVVAQDAKVELRFVDSVDGPTVTLTAPLANTYTGGSIALAALPRFGVARDWVRARLKEDGAPSPARFFGVYLNAQWAVRVETVAGEVLGGGLGIPNQSFFFNKVPVLPGEQIEVRELEGARANVEYPILLAELAAQGYDTSTVRTVTDPRTNKITEVWVLWQERPHFYFSGPDDRHYVVERTRGRIQFGDGSAGKLVPVASGNIRAREYRAGGGVIGNVPAGRINQIMSGVLASGVSNPRAGQGGADGETPEMVRTRGPNVFRHQERSLSSGDYAALAREASPAVAAVRVLSATSPNGRPAAGWVTVIVVPQSQDPQPQPTFELRRQVHDFLAARAPATLAASRITVIGPAYLPVGVSAILVPRDITAAGAIQKTALAALAKFLHPLTGGPDGDGWAFGRGVFLSDVAAILEGIAGVDHAEFLELRLNDTPVGDSVAVPPSRMVVAGPLRIEVRGS